jgi:hypothetical protein
MTNNLSLAQWRMQFILFFCLKAKQDFSIVYVLRPRGCKMQGRNHIGLLNYLRENR